MTMADIMFSHGRLFAIAHCNFHLRPGDCDEDEALVRDWAAQRGITFHRKDFDTAAYAADKGVSIEMAAREQRYVWFSELCAEFGYGAVAVAHNANDNAETLLLNLLRGTGIDGITGMDDSRVLRPLLGMTRRQIEDYAAVHHVPYRTDRTNLENDYKRNKIRNLVFPVFEQINPSFVGTLNRDMEHFRGAAAVLSDWFEQTAPQVMISEDEISTEKLLLTPNWEYLLYMILQRRGFNSSVASSLADLLRSGRTFAGKRFAGPRCSLVTATGRIIFCPEGTQIPSYTVERLPYEPSMNLKCPAGTIIYDSAKVPSDAFVRGWQRGDWFVPFGMRGKKKLSDLFTDLHYTAPRKEAALVLASEGESHVWAVLGVRIDDKIKVTPETSEVTIIRLK